MAKQVVKLSEVPFGAKIKIGGFDFENKGFEKIKTQFGRQEHFVFECKDPKRKKVFERYKFSQTKITKISEDEFEW